MILEMLGKYVTDLMQDILQAESTLPPGFKVDEATVDVELNERSGNLKGQWKIIVKKVNSEKDE